MFKLFVVTLWLEYEGRMYIKYAVPLLSKSNVFSWWSVQEQFKNSKINLVAMKCTRFKDFRYDKRIYSLE